MAFSASYKLTPFFFDGSVNGENYRAMLSDHMIPQLQHKKKMSSVVFQHDGAPPHFQKRRENFYPLIFRQTGLSAVDMDSPGLHDLPTSPHLTIGLGEC